LAGGGNGEEFAEGIAGHPEAPRSAWCKGLAVYPRAGPRRLRMRSAIFVVLWTKSTADRRIAADTAGRQSVGLQMSETLNTEQPEQQAAATAEPEAPQEHPWERLAPEPYQLLRLYPQPFDRATGVRPLRFAQFSRIERHSQKESLLRLSVELPGQSLKKDMNRLDLWVDHQQKEVRFEPMQIDPPNRGLG